MYYLPKKYIINNKRGFKTFVYAKKIFITAVLTFNVFLATLKT